MTDSPKPPIAATRFSEMREGLAPFGKDSRGGDHPVALALSVVRKAS